MLDDSVTLIGEQQLTIYSNETRLSNITCFVSDYYGASNWRVSDLEIIACGDVIRVTIIGLVIVTIVVSGIVYYSFKIYCTRREPSKTHYYVTSKAKFVRKSVPKMKGQLGGDISIYDPTTSSLINEEP